MLRLVVFGGGRWARTLVGALAEVLPQEAEVWWHTTHLAASARAWLAENNLPQVALVEQVDWTGLRAGGAAVGAVVATSPETHFALAHQALSHGIPTLCEKPVASRVEQAEELIRLAADRRCPFGIHLEFLYVSYLDHLAARTAGEACRSVHIEWLDPQVELRHGEVKYPELYTDIASEQLPHCWSVLKRLIPGAFRVSSVEATDAATLVHAHMGEAAVTCELSRCAPRRTRRVSINGGQWILDFSSEPGFIQSGDRTEQLAWSGPRPLARSLGDFISVASGELPEEHWRLSHAQTAEAARAAMHAAQLLREIQDRQIAVLTSRSPRAIEDPAYVRLICDRFLPELAEQGLRLAPRSDAERLEFARCWLDHLSRKM